MFRKVSLIMLAVMLVIGLSHSAFAALAAVGPVNPQNGFPLFYQDGAGLALEMCLDGDGVNGVCAFDPPIAGNAFSQQVGFGSEAFYWSADSLITIPSGSAILVLALESSWGLGDPLNGDQFVFSRLRIRIDAPVNGTYVVTHPFGTEVFTNVVAGPNAINSTVDIGAVTPAFNVALSGDVGPFLTAVAPAAPLGFVGNPLVDQTVTGSPTGNNFFRVQGPAGSNLDGLGGTTVQTDLFAVQGKIFTGAVPANLVIERATYTRNAQGVAIDVFALTDPTNTATLDLGATITPTPVAMTLNSGRAYAHVTRTGAVTLPATVSVTSTPVGNPPTTLTKPLVDEVNITAYAYDSTGQRLLIRAKSSDTATPAPTLTAVGIGPLVNGQILFNAGITTPPPSITVQSSAGGSATKALTVDKIQ
ncbi:hypothetical protein HZA56_21255 [Candidatus Poribacteria bacterium]|nr:hypothetical protein [Candidatus Poribacteria bacterium]